MNLFRLNFLVVALMLTFCGALLTAPHALAQVKMLPPAWEWEPLFTVPLLPNEARHDGVLADNEWQYATKIGGLIDSNTLMQSNQRGHFLLGYHGQDLLLGFKLNRPKGSGAPRMVVDKAGWSAAPLWVRDENLEVWLAPFTENVRESGMMEPRYAVAANAAGAYSHDMTGWDRPLIPQELQYTPILRGELWQGEMRFPWKVISQMRTPQQKRAPADGVQWKGAFFFQQLTPFRALIGAQQSFSALPTLVFSDQPIGFEASSVEPAAAGRARFVAGVRNGSKQNAEYDLHYEIFARQSPPRSQSEQFTSYWQWIQRIKEVGADKAGAERGGVLDMRPVEGVEAELNRQYRAVDAGVKPLNAPPGKTVRAEIEFAAPDGYYVLGYRIVERKSKRVVMRQVIPALLARLPLQVRPEFLQKQKIVVRAEVAAVRGASAGDTLEVRLLDDKGAVLDEQRQTLKLGAGQAQVILSSEKTQPKRAYEVRAKVVSSKAEILAETSETIQRPATPEWFNSKLGLTDRVPPTFEPVQRVENGFTIALRRIVLNDNILPQQIETRGAPFLAAPVQLTARVNGNEVKFSRGKLEVLEAKPTGANLRQLWTGAGITLDIRARLEYDGFLRYDVTANAADAPVKVEALTLDVPVRAEYAQWFAHRELGTRMSGGQKGPYFPYGELADFYKSYPDGRMPFSYQLFLGNRDRGIEWTAESDRFWSPRDENKMMGLQRGNDRVSMVFNFIDAPVEISAPRTITFAVTPTPVRDYPIEKYFGFMRTMGASLTDRTPQEPEKDPETIKLYNELRDMGFRVAHNYINFGPELFSNVRFYDERHLKRVRGVNKLARERKLIPTFYSGFALPPGIPDNETFGNEMRMEPEFRGWYNSSSPFVDYWLHGARWMHENALVDSFHTDGLVQVWLMNNPTYDFNWTRDGKAHGTYPVFATRDLFKRFYIMLKYELPDGREGFHFPHVDGAPIFSLESFSDMEVTGEQHYNTISTLRDLGPGRYGMAYDTLGHGIPRMAIWHYANDIPITKNVMLTLHNLYGTLYQYVNLQYSNHPYETMGGFQPEVLMWKNFNRQTATFLPFTQHPGLAEVTSEIKGVTLPADAVKVSAYVKPDKKSALLIVGNIDPLGYSLRVKPNLQALGLEGKASDYSFSDPILKDYSYPVVGADLRFDIYPQRWRAILIQKRNQDVNLLSSNHPYETTGGFQPEVLTGKGFNWQTATFLPFTQQPGLAEVTSDIKGVTLPADALKVSAYVQPDKRSALLIVSNIDPLGYSLRVKPNLQALGLEGKTSDYSFSDPILTASSYPVVGADLRLDIYPQRWRAIWIRKR